MMRDNILHWSTCDLAQHVQSGDISASEVVTACLSRIEKLNPSLGAFLTVQADFAIENAKRIDQKKARGEKLGPLAGVPIGLKDALCVENVPTTSGSRILTHAPKTGEKELGPSRGWKPAYDATVVARLKAADAILPGKCNMDEFAMGSSNENSAFGIVRNPWDLDRIPGGSSGGSAVSVASSMTPASLGSDTGGSIRQPAALCGVVGVKPTYGRVSRYGLIAFASSLDQIGPLATDVRGAARILEVIAGHDPSDSTSLTAPVGSYEQACGRDIRGLRIGVPEEYFAQGIDPVVESSVRSAIAQLEQMGCHVVPIHLPHTRYAVATYYVIATAEASSNLARFDGVRFGLQVDPKRDLNSLYKATRGAGFGREVKRRIMLGTYVLSAGYYDAYYLRAQQVRTLIRRDFDNAFQSVDIIATPVSPTVAFPLGDRIEDPLAMYLADIYTLPASLAGIPAMSIPCGLSPATSTTPELPIGLHLIAPALHEERMFSVAFAWESISPTRNRLAPIA